MKKESILIIVIVVLAVALGVLGGKLYFDGNKKKDDNGSSELDKNNLSAYEKFVLDYKAKRVETVITGDPENFVPDFAKNISNIKITKDGKATIYFTDSSDYKNEYPNGRILSGTYLFGKSLYYGNGGYYGYYLVKEDGTVIFINEFTGEKFNKLQITENYKNYKEIVDIDEEKLAFININNVELSEQGENNSSSVIDQVKITTVKYKEVNPDSGESVTHRIDSIYFNKINDIIKNAKEIGTTTGVGVNSELEIHYSDNSTKSIIFMGNNAFVTKESNKLYKYDLVDDLEGYIRKYISI